MSAWPRIVLACFSVAIVAAVVVTAAAFGPEAPRRWLLLCGMLAVVAALQSVTAEDRDLAAALLLSLPPVLALASEGSPTWLIASLGALLLMAGELNALSWECQVPGPMKAGIPRRLLDTAGLAAVGLGGSLAVYFVAQVSTFGGTGAVVLAAVALAALGLLLLPGVASDASATGRPGSDSR